MPLTDHAPTRHGDADRDGHDGCDTCAAYTMGKDAALAAASWIIDGNTDQDHVRRLVTMLDDGDPRIDDYLPARPNLSGEMADDPTPGSLAREILGDLDEHDADLVDQIGDAWEEGVDDTFQTECERLLREALA